MLDGASLSMSIRGRCSHGCCQRLDADLHLVGSDDRNAWTNSLTVP